MSPSLWIIVLNFNGLEDSRKCLESLAPVRADAQVLAVDNGSSMDEAAILAREFPWARTLRNPTNEGYAGGNNRGIEMAIREGATHVVLLNNDTTVSPALARRLLTAAAANPAFGIIGPIIAFMEEPDVVRSDACLFNVAGKDGFFQRLVVPRVADGGGTVVETDIVNGCCMMIATEVVTAIGLIDERFFLVHEESDYCLRAIAAGFQCGVLSETLVWHKGSSSFKRAGNGLQRYYDARNLVMLLRKHTGRRGRTRPASWLAYLRYSYFVYCIEKDQGTATSATSVLAGIYDGLSSTFGPRAQRRRPFMGVLRAVFDVKQRFRLGSGPLSDSRPA
jgi:GT2 family glycosyltransferase